MIPVLPPSPRRGMAKGCAIGAAAVLLIVLLVGFSAVSKYNSIVADQQNVEGRWSEIDNQYKRRFDLVPQLVETVKGAADFEKTVLTEVTEARASVGRVQLPSELPTDPAKLEAYVSAQQGLGAAIGRLFAVAENYPQLKATAGFLSLQDQIEGTENRIAVARRDYIDSVQRFNTSIKKFPDNLIASTFGFEKVPQLTAGEAVREVPNIDFGTDR